MAAYKGYTAARGRQAYRDDEPSAAFRQPVDLDPGSDGQFELRGVRREVVRHLVLNRLMESEVDAASGKSHRDSTINPANYSFRLLGEQDLGGNRCFVVQAIPTRKDKYLFDGKVWIDARDYAVVQIVGHPAKKLSMWVDKADFVRRYQKIGDFWLPLKDETSVHVRLYGSKILTIDHQSYTINDGRSEQARRTRQTAEGTQ